MVEDGKDSLTNKLEAAKKDFYPNVALLVIIY